jgi:TolB-like protein/DNA-binding winged helix-turn-helix (wHTH) protein/tetratricopeptide (TPR) repeat protein
MYTAVGQGGITGPASVRCVILRLQEYNRGSGPKAWTPHGRCALKKNMQTEMSDVTASSTPATRFQVLDLEVDAGRQIVSRGGSELHVPKLSFDLLLALVRAAPNTVSVPDLMDRVWPRQVVGVETVAQRVKLLRRALGDEAAQPRYLAGERRRGYRLIAPVSVLPAAALPAIAAPGASPDAAATPPQLPVPPTRRRRLAMALSLMLAVVLAAALINLVAPRKHPYVQGNTAAMAPGAIYSVAVLPFLAVSGGPDDAQLGRGISELVINHLTNEPGLRVIAPDSALAPRAEAESAVEVGRRLGAQYVVDGSVQREGSQVRIAAQLIDVNEGRHVGALLVERSTAQLFHLEDDIAGRISFFLLGKARPEEASVQEFGADATLAYLRGRALLATRKVADADAAVAEFTRAVTAAPTFASAYAGRAEARFQRLFVRLAFDENAEQLFKEMQPDIDRALQLNPGNAPAIFIRAKLRELQDDFDGAESDYQRAMAISRSFAPGVAYYADFMSSRRKKPEAALGILDAGIRLNPLAPRLTYLKALITSQSTHDDVTAAALYLRTIQIAPDYWLAYNRLGIMRWSQGRLGEAIGFAETSVRIDPDVTWSREVLARMYVDLGDLAAAREVLAQFREPPKHEGAALLCYRAHRLEAALTWLRPALASSYTDTGGLGLAASITALLEQATRTGDYGSARAELIKMSWLADEKGALQYNYANELPLLQLATLEQLAGHPGPAQRIATRVLEMPDDPTAQGNLAGDSERVRMLALAILGRDQEALSILEAQRDTAARQLWWVWIERHPALQRLRREPRVQTLLTQLRAWSQQERAWVEVQRRTGKLPVRTAQATPDPCAPTVAAVVQAPKF